MAGFLTPEFGTAAVQLEPSALERGALKVLGCIPGMRRVGPSRRVMVAMRGGAWTMVGYVASQVLRLASTLMLARMLVPQAFGLVALVNVVLSGLEMLSDLGIGVDVVQHPRGDDPRFVNTAFLIQAGRGVILCGLAAALAYPFADFYRQPEVRGMIFAAAISVGLRGFASGSIWTMTRHLRVGKLTALNVGGDFAGFVVSVAWAIVSPTAWALVVGRIASSAVYAVWSHVVAEHPASTQWDSSAATDILAFGAGMFLSSATYFLSGEAERLVIGKFISVAELGCFSLALAMSLAPSRGIQQVIAQVMYPMIARAAREDRWAAAKDFRKARLLLLVTGAALSCGFILFGRFIVRMLLGAKYAEAGWMLQLLGFRAALELFAVAAASMLFAVGVSRYSAIGNVAKLVFLSVGLTIAFGKFGFREAIWVLALSPLANYLPHLWGLKRNFEPAVRTEIVCLVLFLASAVVAALIVRAVS